MAKRIPDHVVKARPRVGAVGFEDLPDEVRYINAVSGTFYLANDLDGLAGQVHKSELDLLITNDISPVDLVQHIHTISFGRFADVFRRDHALVVDPHARAFPMKADLHHYEIDGDAHPALVACANRWTRALDSAKGLNALTFHERNVGGGPLFGLDGGALSKIPETFANAGLIHATNNAYHIATVLMRPNMKGLALLPAVNSSQMMWIEAILQVWSQCDPTNFPVLGEWQKQPSWMTVEELAVYDELKKLEQEEREFMQKLIIQREALEQKLSLLRSEADASTREILTAQDDDLKNAVAEVLRDLGFDVVDQDALTKEGDPKYEDLRISRSGHTWEALVEVKGYSKGAGKTSDLQKVHRGITHFRVQKGRAPDRVFYIVNVEFERATPDRRSHLLPGADEDVEQFSQENGVCMSTVDLFRLHRDRHRLGEARVFELFSNAKGRFLYSGDS